MSFAESSTVGRRSFLKGCAGVAAGVSSMFACAGPSTAQQIQALPDRGPGPEGLHVPDPYAGKKKVLAIGDVHTGYQHDSVSHALATIERLGRESGAFITYIRTDTQLVTKGPVYGTGKYAAPPQGTRRINAKNLNDFDAIFFYGLGEESLDDKQKADLLSFVHDDGKGFVGAHSAIDAFYSWPEYGQMMGAYFDNHPWGVMDAPILVEERSFPGLKHFPQRLTIRDEIYVPTATPYSRERVDVLARLDATKIDLKVNDLHRTDNDFPVAWVKKYGAGKVFYSTLGHLDASWDDPLIQNMYHEALRWSLGLVEYVPRPHPLQPLAVTDVSHAPDPFGRELNAQEYARVA